MDATPQLSCTRCKRRKIRCDKRNPCSSCTDSGAICDSVHRARLPRGRSARAKKSILEERVTRLESLLEKAQNARDKSNGSGALPYGARSQSVGQPNGPIGEFIAPEFWAALAEEVTGLRETLDSSDEEQVRLDSASPAEACTSTNDQGHLIGFPLSPVQRYVPSTWTDLPKDKSSLLLQLYHDRVDCMYKFLHWPTVLADIENLHSEARQDGHPVAVRSLELSIYFMSSTCITDVEAIDLGLGDRASLLERFREAAESAISQAGLLDPATASAVFGSSQLMHSQLGLRTSYNSAASWTLLAVAIRVGTALRLGQESEQRITSFELQLRRRLWYSIAVMDTHASFDRGTCPIIQWKDLGPAPLLLNDHEISKATVPRTSSKGLNDMSFFALMFRAAECHKRMLSIPHDEESGWEAKLELLSEFEHLLERDYLNISQDAQPFQKFMKQAAKGVTAGLNLALRRPPFKQSSRLIPTSDDFNVLEKATEVLKQDLAAKSADFGPWAWKVWVPWHALAIVLAELSSRAPKELDEESYLASVQIFSRYSHLVADSETGMLWRPIARLMHKVRRLRHSNGVGERLPNITGEHEVDGTKSISALDLWVPSFDLDLDMESDIFQHQSDQIITLCGEAELNWSTFTDYINMDNMSNMEETLT